MGGHLREAPGTGLQHRRDRPGADPLDPPHAVVDGTVTRNVFQPFGRWADGLPRGADAPLVVGGGGPRRQGDGREGLEALLSDATVSQFLARPTRDDEGVRLLGTALMLNGVSMAVCGSSRPASGAEHLISHALDAISVRPRLHGLQVGVATYLVSRLHGEGTDRIAEVFSRTEFWEGIRADPFSKAEWIEAIARAPSITPGRYTVLSSKDCSDELRRMIDEDAHLAGCFVP